MTASALIARFARPATVTRYAGGSYLNGNYAAGADAPISIMISAQPLIGRELLNLPEAQRTRQYMKGYTDTELFTASQDGSTKADLVAINGKSYEVQQVEFWDSSGNSIVPHWKVLLAEVNP